MSARSFHARKSQDYFVNRRRHYEFDTYNSDLSGLKSFSMGLFKAAAVRFDRKFFTGAEKLEFYIVLRRGGRYVVAREK